jgi:hypothetical protein
MLLGSILMNQKRFLEAEVCLRECMDIRSASLPAGHWQLGQARSRLGASLLMTGRYEEAEPLLLTGFEILSAKKGLRDSSTVRTLKWLVDLYDSTGRPELAEEYRAQLPPGGGAPDD